MAGGKTPAPYCSYSNPEDVEDGTLCRAPSPLPGSLGVNDVSDPNFPAGASRTRSEYSILFLDRPRLVRFLRSVAYLQVTAEVSRLENSAVGLGFSTTEVNTGSEADKERLVEQRVSQLMDQFAQSCSRGSAATMNFLSAQEQIRKDSLAGMQQLFSSASRQNLRTTKTLEHWVAGLKTTEYGAGIIISVAGIFVSSAAALAAGIIGFSYDTATNVIDSLNKASTVNADALALVSTDLARESGKAAAKEEAKAILAGKELRDIEKLEQKVAHLHQKISIKQAMIENTTSRRNLSRLSRSLGKNRASLNTELKTIGRFKGATLVFLALDVFEKAEKIRDAWKSD
jgi:hypothetical protein